MFPEFTRRQHLLANTIMTSEQHTSVMIAVISPDIHRQTTAKRTSSEIVEMILPHFYDCLFIAHQLKVVN